jgi:cell surface protein SprA
MVHCKTQKHAGVVCSENWKPMILNHLNVSYISFWVMDPFIYKPNSAGGDLYFNLGSISEDILKDGRKSLENGLPVNGDATQVDETNWGRVQNVYSP